MNALHHAEELSSKSTDLLSMVQLGQVRRDLSLAGSESVVALAQLNGTRLCDAVGELKVWMRVSDASGVVARTKSLWERKGAISDEATDFHSFLTPVLPASLSSTSRT